MLIRVPTINNSLDDFEYLFTLWNQVNDDCLNITFNFSNCRFLRPNALAFLGGLARLIEFRCGQVSFDWKTLDSAISMNLKQNGFMYAFNGCDTPWRGNSISYRQDQNLHNIPNYLTQDWLRTGWMTVSQELTNAIVSRVGEIYTNAFEHGRSDIGVFSCGQHYPTLKTVQLTAIDFGVGIPFNVRNFRQNNDLPASETIKWAFNQGNTTRCNNVPSGLGLDLLSKFVRINKGSLEIFSHDGYAMIDQHREIYCDHQKFFEGTLVNITLQCNECYYQLPTEPDDSPLF